MTLFGKRASEDLIQIKMKSWGGPSCIVTGVLTHRGKVTCRHTGRGQLPTSQKKIYGYQKPHENPEAVSSLRLSGET